MMDKMVQITADCMRLRSVLHSNNRTQVRCNEVIVHTHVRRKNMLQLAGV